MRPPSPQVSPGTIDRSARASLLTGVAGLSLLVVVTAGDALTRRDGYDMTRHWISLLQHGGRGWLATVAFGAAGAMVLVSVPGFRAARRVDPSPSRSAAAIPVLVTALGVALVVLAVCPIDPSMEYPVHVDAYVVSTAGRIHSIAGAVVLASFASLCWCIAGVSRGRPRTPGWLPTLARSSAGVIVLVFLVCSTAVVLSDAQSWEAARAGAFQRLALLVGGVWLSWYALVLVAGSPDGSAEAASTDSDELEV